MNSLNSLLRGREDGGFAALPLPISQLSLSIVIAVGGVLGLNSEMAGAAPLVIPTGLERPSPLF
jgi:hypothetical protein